MFYQNKFDTKDLVHYIYYLIQAMLVFIMALHLTLDDHHQWDISRNMAAVSLSAGVSRLYAVVMYIQVMMITRNYRQHIIHVALAQFLSGTLFFLAPYVVEGEKFYWFWLASIAIERVIVHIRIALAIPVKDRAPPHFGHLSHRQVSCLSPFPLSNLLIPPPPPPRELSFFLSLVKRLFNLFKAVVVTVCQILLVGSWDSRSSLTLAIFIINNKLLDVLSSVGPMLNHQLLSGHSFISSYQSLCCTLL
jgi:hypothetical protein